MFYFLLIIHTNQTTRPVLAFLNVIIYIQIIPSEERHIPNATFLQYLSNRELLKSRNTSLKEMVFWKQCDVVGCPNACYASCLSTLLMRTDLWGLVWKYLYSHSSPDGHNVCIWILHAVVPEEQGKAVLIISFQLFLVPSHIVQRLAAIRALSALHYIIVQDI